MASSNNTVAPSLDPFGRSKVQIGFEVTVAVCIALTTILGNCLVVFVINKDGNPKNITNVFIHNLAWTDISMASMVMPFWIVSLYNGRWIFSKELCDFTGTVALTSGGTSLWTMGLIAVNRYLKVVKQNLYPKFFPGMTMARVYCGSAWLMGVLCATPPLYGWGRYAYNERSAVCNVVWEKESISNVIVYSAIFGGIFNVIQFCYYKIYQKVKVTSSNLAAHVSNNSQSGSHQVVDTKLLKVTFVIVCAYVVCYTPAAVVTVCDVITGATVRAASAAIMYLVFVSSAVNPIIYGLMNPPLKRAFVKALSCGASGEERQTIQPVNSQNAIATPGTPRPAAVQPTAQSACSHSVIAD